MTFDQLQSVVIFVSLVLTFPTIAIAALVCHRYGKRARKAVDDIVFKKKQPKEVQLLIIGIVVSFLGSMIDNVYWGAAWSSRFLNLGITETLFTFGAWSNIPFRQITGILAGLFHLWAAVLVFDRLNILRFLAGLTLLIAAFLLVLKAVIS